MPSQWIHPDILSWTCRGISDLGKVLLLLLLLHSRISLPRSLGIQNRARSSSRGSMSWAMHRCLLSQALLAACVFAIPQTCVFESGTADDYVPCNPNASQGTCCYQGEACLDSGLCYGQLGVYRGACINDWSSDSCVTYCADSKSTSCRHEMSGCMLTIMI